MLKRYNNIIYKLFLRSKKTIKVILSSITKIRLIIYIKDPKEALSVDHIYIEEDTEVKEITILDIITTSHSIKNNTISITNLDISQVNILLVTQGNSPVTTTRVGIVMMVNKLNY